MPFIYWTQALETGHSGIDADHRRLVELLNDVQAASEGGERDALLEILAEVERFTEYHFAHEEALMAGSGHVGAEAHRAEHRKLFRELARYRGEFNAGRIVAASLALYMQRWLIHHIVTADRELGAALRARVAAPVA